jgi:hypothetical protein
MFKETFQKIIQYSLSRQYVNIQTFSYLILNCKQFTKLYILLTCQQIGVNTFYKCIEFQVNSFDSYGEILIILKKYP